MTKNIILEAHSWLGTKFKHQGRIKRSENDPGGCDCLGFIMGLNLLTKNGEKLQNFDQTNYPRLVKSNVLKDKFDLLFDKSEIILPGCILLIKINNWPQHLVLVVESDPCVIIHSYLQARKVVKQHLPEEWKNNVIGMYKI